MLSGATLRASAMAGAAVFRIVVSNDSIKNATATSHGNNSLLAVCSEGAVSGLGMAALRYVLNAVIHRIPSAGTSTHAAASLSQRNEPLPISPANAPLRRLRGQPDRVFDLVNPVFQILRGSSTRFGLLQLLRRRRELLLQAGGFQGLSSRWPSAVGSFPWPILQRSSEHAFNSIGGSTASAG
jgi:hypothetical protein